jgi:hypothetical protein
MSNLYHDGKELFGAAMRGAREGFDQAHVREGDASDVLRCSVVMLAGSAVSSATAVFIENKPAKRILRGAAIALTGLAIWNSREVIGRILGPAGKAFGSARDTQWLRHNPIDYA